MNNTQKPDYNSVNIPGYTLIERLDKYCDGNKEFYTATKSGEKESDLQFLVYVVKASQLTPEEIDRYIEKQEQLLNLLHTLPEETSDAFATIFETGFIRSESENAPGFLYHIVEYDRRYFRLDEFTSTPDQKHALRNKFCILDILKQLW